MYRTEGIKSLTSTPKYDKWQELKDKFNENEQKVIQKSSIIQGSKINPWLPEDEIVPILQDEGYVDPDGLMILSQEQSRHFSAYKRPWEFIPIDQRSDTGSIIIADEISGFEINQRSVSDCSVICSIALAAQMELKHKYAKWIISCNIYPQDSTGWPIYNPFG